MKPAYYNEAECDVTTDERTAEDKAKMAADPRFAAWNAAMPAPLPGIEFLAKDDPQPDPDDIRRREDRIELLRRAKVSFLAWAEGNPQADPIDVQAARDFLATHRPLQRPLGTGELLEERA